MGIIKHIGITRSQIIFSLPFLLILSTVFIIMPELPKGVVTGKYFWFYYCCIWTCLTVVLLYIISRKNIRINWGDGLIILFTGSVAFSSFFINKCPINTQLRLFFLCCILYFSFRFIINRYRHIHYLFITFLIITTLEETIIGLKQLYGWSLSNHALFRLTGSFFNPGPYAGYLSIIFPLALSFTIFGIYILYSKTTFSEINNLKSLISFIKNNRKYTILIFVSTLSFLSILLSLTVLPASMSRAAWISTIVGCIVSITNCCVQKKKINEYYHKYLKYHKFTLSIIVIITAIICFNTYLLKQDSANGRILIWKIAITNSVKYPWGVGLGNFAGTYGKMQSEYFSEKGHNDTEIKIAGAPDYAFNEYIQILIESGYISLLFFILLNGYSLYKAYQTKKYPAIAAITSLLTFALFSYPFSVLPILIVYTFLLAWCNTSNYSPKWKRTKQKNSISIILLIIMLSSTLYLVKDSYGSYTAYKAWEKQKIYFNTGIYEDIIPEYQRLYPWLKDNKRFLFEYAQCLSKSKQYFQSNEIIKEAIKISGDPAFYNIAGKNYQAMKNYHKAEKYYLQSIHTVPNRLYPYYLLVKLYKEIGDEKKSKKYASILLQKEPKVPSTAIKEMRTEIKKILEMNNENNHDLIKFKEIYK